MVRPVSAFAHYMHCNIPDSKVHGANMGPTWVLSAPGGPHVGAHKPCYQGYWQSIEQSSQPQTIAAASQVDWFFNVLVRLTANKTSTCRMSNALNVLFQNPPQLKMQTAKRRSFCLGLNMLTTWYELLNPDHAAFNDWQTNWTRIDRLCGTTCVSCARKHRYVPHIPTDLRDQPQGAYRRSAHLHPGGCCNIRYSNVQCRELSFVQNSFLSCPILLKSFTEYSSVIAVLCEMFESILDKCYG